MARKSLEETYYNLAYLILEYEKNLDDSRKKILSQTMRHVKWGSYPLSVFSLASFGLGIHGIVQTDTLETFAGVYLGLTSSFFSYHFHAIGSLFEEAYKKNTNVTSSLEETKSLETLSRRGRYAHLAGAGVFGTALVAFIAADPTADNIVTKEVYVCLGIYAMIGYGILQGYKGIYEAVGDYVVGKRRFQAPEK